MGKINKSTALTLSVLVRTCERCVESEIQALKPVKERRDLQRSSGL